MNRTCIVLHHHQPVGNLQASMVQAFEQTYEPILAWLEQSGLALGLHYSGALLEWLLEHRPGFVDRVKKLLDVGQVELLGGPMYAPLLPLIPSHDALDQCVALSQLLEDQFGVKATGAWLPEFAWEPSLVSVLQQAGITYTLLPENDLIAAGVDSAALNQAFITDDGSQHLRILSCSGLSASFGHQPADLVVQQLAPSGLMVLAVDAERFAGKLVWLEQFSLAVKTIKPNLIRPCEAFEAGQPLPSVHVPSGISLGLMRFSRPHFASALEQVPPGLEPFVRGASWQAFGQKYPELRHLMRRMWRVSEKLRHTARPSGVAWKALWQAQCGNAYWHGTSGGATENYLRSGVYRNLILAENAIEPSKYGWLEIEYNDYDLDGLDEIIAESHALNLYFQPKLGGAVVELDHRQSAFNVLDAFANPSLANSGHPSPHRHGLIDHFIGAETSFEEFAGSYLELGDFVSRAYQAGKYRDRVSLQCVGFVRGPVGEPVPVEVKKAVRVLHKESKLEIEYRITNLGQTDIITRFGCEWNFGLLVPDAPDRAVLVNGKKAGNFGSGLEHRDVRHFVLQDQWLGLGLEFDFGREVLLWQHPNHTQEGELRRYQSTLVMPLWDLDLPVGRSRRIHFELALRALPTPP